MSLLKPSIAPIVRWIGPLILIWLATGAAAQIEPPRAAPDTLSTNLPFKATGPGLFELGNVRLDTRQRTVSFPAQVNLRDTLIEYLVVTDSGKTHESLLRTTVDPYQIHVAMLLLGARGAVLKATNSPSPGPLRGDRLSVEISWISAGRTNRMPAGRLVHNRRTKGTLGRKDWIYTGSRLLDGQFVAQSDGSIIALMRDLDALINHPQAAKEDDENWVPNLKEPLPALNAPVVVTIQLLK